MKYHFRIMLWLLGLATAALFIDSILSALLENISPLLFTIGFLCLLGFGMAAVYNLLVFVMKMIKKQRYSR